MYPTSEHVHMLQETIYYIWSIRVWCVHNKVLIRYSYNATIRSEQSDRLNDCYKNIIYNILEFALPKL